MFRYFKIVLLLLPVLIVKSYAQQIPVMSQYMFNGLVINPAYAGSKDYMSTTLMVRKQWAGYEGSPVTENASIHGP